MNKNKFRNWNHKHKQFQEMDLPQSQQQFIGILDCNMREIYERGFAEMKLKTPYDTESVFTWKETK